jgi:hypothetical protein
MAAWSLGGDVVVAAAQVLHESRTAGTTAPPPRSPQAGSGPSKGRSRSRRGHRTSLLPPAIDQRNSPSIPRRGAACQTTGTRTGTAPRSPR